MRLEKELMKQIENRLSVYELTGEVEWWTRLNAGRVKTYYGSYIRLAKKGTPDYVALINGKEGLLALFIEAKSDTGKIRKEQQEFTIRYGKPDIIIMTVRNISQLDAFIMINAKDFVKDIGT